VLLFLVGGLAALVGDHAHVVTATTVYYTAAVPFIWSSPVWFPVLVGSATVSLAELRLHLPRPRNAVPVRRGIGGIAAVVGMYVTTALVHTAPPVAAVTLITTLVVIVWCELGDNPSLICGALAATLGPIAEIILVRIGVFAYTPGSDGLFGAGPWLVPLYFAFGVVAALLGEICRSTTPR